MKRSIVFLSLVMLTGCQSMSAVDQIGPAETMAPSPGALGQRTAGVITRQFAGPLTYLGPMPTAVVLLRRDQETRNGRFCDSYVRLRDLGGIGGTGGEAPNMLLTRWPLAAPALEASPTDCDRMVRGYDFTRAEALIGAFTLQEGAAVGATGPHILIIYPDDGAIIVDGSAVPTNELGQWATSWAGALNNMPREPVAQPGRPGRQTGQPQNGAPGTQAEERAEDVSGWETARRGAYRFLGGLHAYASLALGALTWVFAPVPDEGAS